MRLNTKQVCEYVGGTVLVEPIDASELAEGISWDSRELRPGELFVALEGETHDGHDYLDTALRAGIRIALVARRPAPELCSLAREMGVAVIEVSNTYAAITDLARAWRSHLRGKVIAVTGSVGKTTTKDLIAQVLASEHSVVATHGNQNNELGVPKTILAANPETEFVVVEMGMRGSGQIKALCDLAKPDRGLITNVTNCHIELLGSRDAIAKAKAELFACLPAGTGIAFMDFDLDRRSLVEKTANLAGRNIEKVFYAVGAEAGVEVESDSGAGSANIDGSIVHAEDIHLDGEGKPHFNIVARTGSSAGEKLSCTLKLRGEHNVRNALAAAAVCLRLGMSLPTVVKALEEAEPALGRQRVLRTREGATVIDDAYNANPDSMRAALHTFSKFETPGSRIAVLGDMGELGEDALACHEGIGRYAASLPIDKLICVGELAHIIAEAAYAAGMIAAKIQEYDSLAEALEELESTVEKDDVVLVKASHFMNFDRIVKGLVN